MRVAIYHQEEARHDQQCNQGEFPVQIEHHQYHAHQRKHVDEHAEHYVRNQALDRIDVAGHPADEIAGAFVIVICQRQSLNMPVKHPAQVMHHPLTDAGGEIFFEIRTDGSDNCDRNHREDCKIQDR